MAEFKGNQEFIGEGGELSLLQELWIQEVVALDAQASQVLSRNSLDTAYEWTTPSSGVTDHGLLSGLADDDHTQYFLADGTREMSGSISFDTDSLYNLGTTSVRLANIYSDSFTGNTITLDGATGVNEISLTDNVADALSIKRGSDDWIVFDSRNGAEKIVIQGTQTNIYDLQIIGSDDPTGLLFYAGNAAGTSSFSVGE